MIDKLEQAQQMKAKAVAAKAKLEMQEELEEKRLAAAAI